MFKLLFLVICCSIYNGASACHVRDIMSSGTIDPLSACNILYQPVQKKWFRTPVTNLSGKKSGDLLFRRSDVTENFPKVVLFPNPFHGPDQTLRFINTTRENITVMIFDSYGKQLYWRKFYQPSGLVRIRTGLPAGSYTLILEGMHLYQTEKFIVTK